MVKLSQEDLSDCAASDSAVMQKINKINQLEIWWDIKSSPNFQNNSQGNRKRSMMKQRSVENCNDNKDDKGSQDLFQEENNSEKNNKK